MEVSDMAKFYTGIGSRKTPKAVLDIMARLATKLAEDGWTLRSGGASGADSAFEAGAVEAGGSSEIYLEQHATTRSMEIASQFHPAWDRCSPYARRLHGRNAFQVLGINLNRPSRFVVCWTPDGAVTHSERVRETGGTGTAISIADHFHVPVFNLARPDHLKRIGRYLQK